MSSPFLSVIVPTRQSSEVVGRALEALRASDLPRECWELIVVDDASSDDSPAIAAAHADVVVRLPGEPRGTGYALNRGFDVARGEYVAFVSAGACVFPDTLRRLVTALAADSGVTAACGGFTCEPAGPAGLVSSYGGLYESHLLAASAGETDSFSPTCGIVRASAFARAGMFDEWCVGRPRAAAAEMGRRLRSAGGRIVVRPDICVRPIRALKLAGVLATALRDDGLPSTPADAPAPDRPPARLAAREVRRAEHWSAGLSAAALALAALAVTAGLPLAWLGVLALVGAVDVANGAFFSHVARARGVGVAMRVAPLHVLRTFFGGLALAGGWLYRHVLGERRPRPTVQAFAEVGLTVWPPVPTRRRSASAAAVR